MRQLLDDLRESSFLPQVLLLLGLALFAGIVGTCLISLVLALTDIISAIFNAMGHHNG